MSATGNAAQTDVFDAMFHRYKELNWFQKLFYPSRISQKFKSDLEKDPKDLNDFQKDALAKIKWDSLPWYNRFFGQFFASVRAFARYLNNKPETQNPAASAALESSAVSEQLTAEQFLGLFTPKSANIHGVSKILENAMGVLNTRDLLPIWKALNARTTPSKEVHYNKIMSLVNKDNAAIAIKEYVEKNMDTLFSKDQKTVLQKNLGFWQSKAPSTTKATPAHGKK